MTSVLAFLSVGFARESSTLNVSYFNETDASPVNNVCEDDVDPQHVRVIVWSQFAFGIFMIILPILVHATVFAPVWSKATQAIDGASMGATASRRRRIANFMDDIAEIVAKAEQELDVGHTGASSRQEVDAYRFRGRPLVFLFYKGQYMHAHANPLLGWNGFVVA